MGWLRKHPWSTNQQDIMEAVTALIDDQIPITLQRQGDRPLQSRIVGVYSHCHVPYLLIARPAGLTNAYQVRDLLFKLNGLPILGFSCPITREGDSILATMLPTALFALELRQGARHEALPGSIATFFVPNRPLVNICVIVNISMGGVKLSGHPTHIIKLKDRVGPCTLSLAGPDSLIHREVTINTASVVRVEQQQGRQQIFGFKFELNDGEAQEVREQLDFLDKVK